MVCYFVIGYICIKIKLSLKENSFVVVIIFLECLDLIKV